MNIASSKQGPGSESAIATESTTRAALRLHLYDSGTETPTTHQVVDTEGIRFEDVSDVRADDVLVLLYDDGNPEELLEINGRTAIFEVIVGPNAGLVRNPLRQIALEINYAGQLIELNVHGATLVRNVIKMAVAAAGIDPQTAADLQLRLSGSDRDLKSNLPIGSYVHNRERSLDLDLVHLHRPQG